MLITRLPFLSVLPWALIAGVGAATVVSFALMPEYFPKEMSGRANAALNILQLTSASLMQSATGAIVDLWPGMGPWQKTTSGHPLDFAALTTYPDGHYTGSVSSTGPAYGLRE